MKRTFRLLVAGVIALMAFAACDDDETETVIDNGQEEYDDAYYAAQASVTSSDANFTATDEGGEIWFKTEGGSVTLSVSCGTQWTVGNTAADLFETSATSSSLTITAGQNTVERELEGTITLRTANQRITFATISITQSAYGAPEISIEAGEWNFPAKGALTAEIAVEASADWTAATGDSWLTVARDGDVLRLAAEENAQTNERSAKVTLTCTDRVGTAYEYVTVTQEAGAYITTSPAAVTFLPAGGTTSVAVESNYEWDYSYDSSNGWFSVSRDGDTLTVTADENGGEDRSGEITLTAGDGAENVTEVQLSISQVGTSAMVLTYRLTSSNTTTRLPLYGTVDCTVDWGDGTSERVTSAQPSHTYTGVGNFDITISGTVTALNSQSIYSSSSPLPLTAVKQWGKTGLTDMQYAFYYCEKLASIPEQTGDVFAEVTNFDYCFTFCTSLEEIPADLFCSCTKVTSFAYTFWSCSAIETIPSGLFDNCPEVTNFEYTFYMCSALEAIPAGIFDKCTKATNFSYTFGFDTLIDEIPTGLFDNCTEATNFECVFLYCSFKEIPAGLFDNCTKITTLTSVFEHCYALEKIPDGLFDNCTGVTNIRLTFFDCRALEKIPDGLFDRCTKAKSFSNAFYGCTALEEIPKGLFDNCTEVTDFSYVFYGCTALKAIPEGLFDNCHKVTTFSASFYQCTGIEELPDGMFDSCTEVTDFSTCFSGCSALKTIPEGLFGVCSAVTTFKATFQLCTSLTEVPEGLFDKCTAVTDFSFVFNLSGNIAKVPIGLFDHNLKVTNFSQALCSLYVVEGESPYTEIQVNGEKVNVHLYERANYTSQLGCVAPTSYSQCFTNSPFSDISSIPSSWGGRGAELQTKGIPIYQETQQKKFIND